MKKILLFLPILLLGFSFHTSIAFASTFLSQTDYSTSQIGDINGSYRFTIFQKLGTGISGEGYSLRYKTDGPITSGVLLVHIYCFDDASYSVPCSSISSYQFGLDNGSTQISTYWDSVSKYVTLPLHNNLRTTPFGNFDQSLVFDTSKYYVLQVYNNNLSGDLYSFGSSYSGSFPDTEDTINGSHSTNYYMFGFEFNNTSFSTVSRLENALPSDGSITSGTSVPIGVDYFLNSSTAFGDETGLVVYLERIDSIENLSFVWSSITFDNLTTISHTFDLPTGSQWDARFYILRPPNTTPNIYRFDNLGSPTGVGDIPNFNMTRFSVVDSVADIYSAYTDCSITNISGCMQNALVFLFYPSSSSLSQFSNLYDKYINKPPFGYISSIITELGAVNDSTNSAFVLESMPILNTYIFDPFRTALSWVLWVAFAFILFHRLKNIHL